MELISFTSGYKPGMLQQWGFKEPDTIENLSKYNNSDFFPIMSEINYSVSIYLRTER